KSVEFRGVLKGPDLAAAYSDLDAFLFPSKTDTFGNVILESMASVVPVIVTDKGGPQFLVSQGNNGFIAASISHFIEKTMLLMRDNTLLKKLKREAQISASDYAWPRVLDDLNQAYQESIRTKNRDAQESFQVDGNPATGLSILRKQGQALKILKEILFA